tara:strand:- start:3823 stop:4065 length:243 start_codon:yes stop_codon:yes gene_type:complete
MTLLFPLIYLSALLFLIWKAFKVMSNGWSSSIPNRQKPNNTYNIHPELLDKSGNITQEELLTVRFSNDSDSTLEKGSTPD